MMGASGKNDDSESDSEQDLDLSEDGNVVHNPLSLQALCMRKVAFHPVALYDEIENLLPQEIRQRMRKLCYTVALCLAEFAHEFQACGCQRIEENKFSFGIQYASGLLIKRCIIFDLQTLESGKSSSELARYKISRLVLYCSFHFSS